MQFVHDEAEKEGGEGAALFDGFVHLDRRGGAVGDVCAHGKGCACEGLHDKLDKVWGECEAEEAVAYAGPLDCVVGFGDVVVDCVAGSLCACTVFETGGDRVNGFVNVMAREESKLCFVDEVVFYECSREAAGDYVVKEAADDGTD